MEGKLHFVGQKAPSGAQMLVSGALRRQKPAFPKLAAQKSKVRNFFCRSPLASACNGPPFFAIFGPARGHIFGRKAEKIVKNEGKIAFLGLLYRLHAFLQ